jgi:hypothetical protein
MHADLRRPGWLVSEEQTTELVSQDQEDTRLEGDRDASPNAQRRSSVIVVYIVEGRDNTIRKNTQHTIEHGRTLMMEGRITMWEKRAGKCGCRNAVHFIR